jgi:ammonium transporter, Amt family
MLVPSFVPLLFSLCMFLLFSYWQHGYHTYDVVYTMNGCLTGLAAITGPCASVDTWAAVIIGIGSGIVYTAGSKLMIKLRIDDAVCISCHL